MSIYSYAVFGMKLVINELPPIMEYSCEHCEQYYVRGNKFKYCPECGKAIVQNEIFVICHDIEEFVSKELSNSISVVIDNGNIYLCKQVAEGDDVGMDNLNISLILSNIQTVLDNFKITLKIRLGLYLIKM